MHPKMLSIRYMVTCFLFALFAFSCKKETAEHQPGPQHSKDISETAYPGVQGESVGVKLGNDSCYFRKIGEDQYIWMGDIVLDKTQVDSLVKLHNTPPNERTFHNNTSRLWPNAEVFYTIEPGFSANEQQMILAAINHWQTNTPLTFTARTTQNSYIRIIHGASGSGLYSTSIGMNGGQQILNLESGFGTGNVIHEIGHNIGFYHEQCRTDRGNAINVFYDNVVPHTTQNIYQFQTYAETGQGGDQIGNFDFGSVMLYSSFAFSDNIHPVMTRLDGSTFVGQRIGLSAGDIETANFMYRPVFATFTKNITWYQSDMFNDVRSEDYTVEFFSDAQHTQPLTLTTAISINYTVYRSEYQNRMWNYTTNNYTATVGPGASSYPITSTSWDLRYDQNMNPLDGIYSEEAGLRPGFGYR